MVGYFLTAFVAYTFKCLRRVVYEKKGSLPHIVQELKNTLFEIGRY